MLKFIKHHMETITGIEIYPLISLLIFFIFFTVLILWALRTNKALFSEMQNLPLDGKRQVLATKELKGHKLKPFEQLEQLPHLEQANSGS